jgi:hypothetical protein
MDDPKQLPSIKTMVLSLSETLQNMLKTAAQHKVILATEEQAHARLDICLQCEHLIVQQEQARCAKCGCGMKYKARIAAAHCPLQKWGPITS